MEPVDVVVVSYNSSDHLRACVEPLARAADVHVVVVDNASEDDSLASVADLPLTAVALECNGGFSHGCNVGLRKGTAPFVLLLNPDAVIDESSLRRLVRVLEEDDFLSPETLKKENEVIFSKVADIVRSVFSPENFLENAKKMKGLQKVEIEVKVAVNQIATLPGMTEEIRDDILSAYEPLNQQKDTLLDLQRAVTAAAHARRETDKESAYVLEELGGQIIEKGEAVLK